MLCSENWEVNFDNLLQEFAEPYGKCENKNYTVMAHTQVNFSVSPRLEIGVLLLELGMGLVSRLVWYLTW